MHHLTRRRIVRLGTAIPWLAHCITVNRFHHLFTPRQKPLLGSNRPDSPYVVSSSSSSWPASELGVFPAWQSFYIVSIQVHLLYKGTME